MASGLIARGHLASALRLDPKGGIYDLRPEDSTGRSTLIGKPTAESPFQSRPSQSRPIAGQQQDLGAVLSAGAQGDRTLGSWPPALGRQLDQRLIGPPGLRRRGHPGFQSPPAADAAAP